MRMQFSTLATCLGLVAGLAAAVESVSPDATGGVETRIVQAYR